MRRILTYLALSAALAFTGIAVAQDKKAEPAPAPAAAAPAPADAKAAPGAPAPAAGAPGAAAPAAPPAPDKPVLIAADKINSGDTAWMLTSMALVLMMTVPGLALFYGGMVRKKNVLATLMQSFAITCLVTVVWVIAGYSIAFMPGGPFFGSLDRLFMNGMLYQ